MNCIKMKKAAHVMCVIALCVVLSVPAEAFEPPSSYSGDLSGELSVFLSENYNKNDRPVLFKYMAAENKSGLITNVKERTAAVVNDAGEILKQYENVLFFNGEAVIDAGVIERDLGWAGCVHNEHDWFFTKSDAAAAAAFTYLSTEDPIVFYVGYCYFGWYFSKEKDKHSNSCNYKPLTDMHEDAEITVSIRSKERAQINDAQADGGFVLLKYIARKNGMLSSYSSVDDKTTLVDNAGKTVISYKFAPRVNNSVIIKRDILERDLSFTDLFHAADVDLFDTAHDAVTAGWLTYYERSFEGAVDLYIGSCYSGSYFSLSEGAHGKICSAAPITGIHEDTKVILKNGEIKDYDFNAKQYDRLLEHTRIVAHRPADSLLKMVTLTHTQYDNEDGVQSMYYSLRDRVYRNFWEDIAGYDSNDYIFIPPPVTKPELAEVGTAKDYINQNAVNAAALVNAAKKLLAQKKDANIWVGTPGVTSENFNYAEFDDSIITDFINKVRLYMPTEMWRENVKGVYINQESLYGEEAQCLNQIDAFKNVVFEFKHKNAGKKALWIPYYDMAEGETAIAERISFVSRIPGLFDYIIIQPGYFFLNDGVQESAHRKNNLTAIAKSAQNGGIISANVSVGGLAPVFSEIGLLIEFQNSYFSNSMQTRDEAISRYANYLITGTTVKDDAPLAFYVSGDPHLSKEWLVYKFHGAEKVDYNVVKKRLDQQMNLFYSYVFEAREKENAFIEYAQNVFMSKTGETKERFNEICNKEAVILTFYKYEKAGGIGDIAQLIKQGDMPPTFDEDVLSACFK